MNPSKPNGSIDFRQVAAISDRITLDDVRLSSVEGSLLSSVDDAIESQRDVNLTVSARGEVRPESRCIDVSVFFAIEANQKTPPVKFLALKATFILRYSIDTLEGITDEQVQAFSQVNGTYNAWPYLREFVQSLTSRMGLPPLLIPVFRVPRPRREKPISEGAASEEASAPKR